MRTFIQVPFEEISKFNKQVKASDIMSIRFIDGMMRVEFWPDIMIKTI